MTPKLLDRVKIMRDIPLRNLKKGMVGTVVFVHEAPRKAFEVEFCDDLGGTIAQLPLTVDEIEPV